MVSVLKPNGVEQKRHEDALAKAMEIPSFVTNVFDSMIAENYSHGKAVLKQNDVIERIIKYSGNSVDRAEIFKEHYLDVEPLYREAGWKVIYDKAAYYETESYFIFEG